MKVWPTPSEAIKHEACAVCLGGGETFDIVLDRLGPCSGCGGSGLLDDMLARQCDDPDCPEHGVGSIKCPRCGMRSYNPHDAREGYCGNCHEYIVGCTDDDAGYAH